MKRLISFVCILLALLMLTACGKTEVPPGEPPQEVQQEVQQETPQEASRAVFGGIYRDCVPEVEGEEEYVQITDFGEFLLLEHFLCMDGSVYSFWAEEFWPYEGSYQQDMVYGQSQTFSMQTAGDLYDTMPQNRSIALTDEGVVLNYDDSDAEYYVKDETFSYHSTAEELRQNLGEAAAPDERVLGTWGYHDGYEAGCVTFREDGVFSFLWKTLGEPVQVYDGVFTEGEGSLQILAEKAGDGTYPHHMQWNWSIDEYGGLGLAIDGEVTTFQQTEAPFALQMAQRDAMACLGSWYDMSDTYTDQYETFYLYTYRLPQFYGDDAAVMAVNRQIMDDYSPLIEEELQAMTQGEFLSYTDVNWESDIYEGVLYLHIWAETFNWQEHSAYYYDLEEGVFLTTEEVLDRLLIDRDYFLEAVRQGAEEVFTSYFSDIPKEEREEYGYYEMLEWTVSEEVVNFELPIYVDRWGSIAVYARIGSMAGAGEFRTVLYPFDGAVG